VTAEAPLLGYVIHYVRDVAATLDFHERAFGLTRRFLHESGTYGELETGGTALAFASEAMVTEAGASFRPTRPGETPPGIEIALTTTDVPALFDRAVAAGAAPVAPPARKPWGQTVAYVRDADGLLVELCTPMGGASA
jgi:lactoylglutathione lyase